ncbi:methyltransferase [Haloarchaeobius sp. HRN-SO-5]|uniref:methyltransferase n=1 Tax=Haloarchaeobius sp. HRN-SO-5 TaxID=3446118 RepID=UPI003EB937F7
MPVGRHAPDLTLDARVEDGPSRYEFHTVDGVTSPDAFRDADLALLEALWDDPLGDLCVPEANYGVVGCVLSAVAGSTHLTESSARAARCCERNVAANGVDATVSLLADCTDLDRTFDTAAYAPKSYTPVPVGKRRLVDALASLRPGGSLYVAGTDRTGLSRYEDCLTDVAASVETVGDHAGCRVLAATRPDELDRPAFVTPRTLAPTVDGVDLELVSVPGTFSAGSLDDGTRLLLEAATVDDGERVLDLCCGYGAVGAYAGRVADCDLWLSDDDAVATACAECSLAASGVEGTVVTADCVDGVADRRFDRILSNPPTHAGAGVLSDLFAGMERVLAPGGRATLVHHRDLDLGPYLDRFETVEQVRVGAEHVVLEARP